MRNKIVLFILVLLLGAFLRFYNLGKVPPSPDWDEVAIGWNAYSILKTGRDEFGTKLPLTFRSFDDYKPPLYFYLTVPSVAVFGVNTFAVRFPSAIFGILGVAGTYCLVKILFENELLALYSMFFMAVSPWHLQFSRIGFEANAALFLVLMAVFLFLKATKTKANFLLLSAFLFGLAMYSYHSARIFVPLIVILLSLIYKKELMAIKKQVLMAILIGLFFSLPLVRIMTSTEGQMRMKGVSAFSNPIDLLAKDAKRAEEDLDAGFILGPALHNRRLRYGLRFLESYFSHFDFNWLFVNGEGDIPRHHVPDMGMLYFFELSFIILGIYSLFFAKNKKAKKLLFSWWLLSPIAASVSADVPHAVRTLCFLPSWHIFTGLGLLSFIQWLRKEMSKNLAMIFYGLLFCGFLFNFVFYLHQYHVHQNREYSRYWQYGYRQLYEELERLEEKYENFRISIEAEQPYMFFLFYKHYDPDKYLANGGTKSGGFWEEHKIDQYSFIRFDWENEKERKDDKTIWVVTEKEFPGEVQALKTINSLDGKPIFYIFKI